MLNNIIFGLIVTIIIIFIIKMYKKKIPSKETTISTNKNSPIDIDMINKYSYIDTTRFNEDDELRADVVARHKMERGPTQTSFTNKQINKYRDNFLDANNNFNNVSRNTVTVTDKLNEMFTSHGNEMMNQYGETIANVFDNLLKDQTVDIARNQNNDQFVPSNNGFPQNNSRV